MVDLPPFDKFLAQTKPLARISKFHPRYPFALDRGPAAYELQAPDTNNPFGHEPELAHLLDRHVPDDGVFLDVGANAGYFSVYLATRPNFHGSIHAYEPVATTFETLEKIVTALKCDDIVTCHQVAASDKVGTTRMIVPSPNSGLSSISEAIGDGGELVKTISLDSMRLDRVDFAKIDVEGHEAQTLKGAERLIAKSRPFIFLESWMPSDNPEQTFEPLQFLIDRGYNLYLPAWEQPNGTTAIGIGPLPIFERETFSLHPFSTFAERHTFPGEQLNIFAAPKEREAELGELPLAQGTAAGGLKVSPMAIDEKISWIRKLWREFIPLKIRISVGRMLANLMRFKSTAVQWVAGNKANESVEGQLARDIEANKTTKAQIARELEATNARIAQLTRDMEASRAIEAQLMRDMEANQAIEERLARDLAFTQALAEYYVRERKWKDAGGRFQAPANLPTGLLSDIDMAAIAHLAAKVPSGGTIIDIGSLAGRTTTLWCHYSQAGRIISIDPWDDQPWNVPLRNSGASIRETFLQNVTDKRVTSIQGFSPECANDWTEPVDLYWEDGDHSNPTCTNSIGFWSNHVKPGGIACGHDYHIVDVKSTVDALAEKWNGELNLFGSVWWIRRPTSI
jgi:FkbM family methyltransferase